MSEVLQCFFSQNRRYDRASPQELYPLPQFLGNFREHDLYKKVNVRRIIKYEAIFMLDFRLNHFVLLVMSEVLQKNTQKRRYSRSLLQELYLLPQFLGGFGKLNFYKKVSGKLKVIYEAIFMLGFRYKAL